VVEEMEVVSCQGLRGYLEGALDLCSGVFPLILYSRSLVAFAKLKVPPKGDFALTEHTSSVTRKQSGFGSQLP